MNEYMKKVLVVEDEIKIIEVVKSFLESKGFLVLYALNGKQALELFDKDNFSLVILDLMLPEISGEEVCTIIRKQSKVPIIMLTAKANESDLLQGLGNGADDYITKPFSLKALYARIEAVLRRSENDMYTSMIKKSFYQDDLTIDFESRIIRKKSEEVRLTPNEYRILTTLVRYPNKVFTRDELIASAFGNDFEGYDRTIDSHIKNIRHKIETDPKNPVYVKTIHGIGYKFGGE